MRRVLRIPLELNTTDYVVCVCEMNESRRSKALPKTENCHMMSCWTFYILATRYDSAILRCCKADNLQVCVCELMEATEPDDENIQKKKTSFGKVSDNVSKKRKKNSSSDGSRNFVLHGDRYGHSSHECHTLEYLVGKMKDKYNSNGIFIHKETLGLEVGLCHNIST